jgi:hypothetical protein
MVGLLVCGDNHFIVQGPKPDLAQARALARTWSIIHIGGTTALELAPWTICTRAFREDLEWAIVLDGDRMSEAVADLLRELADRGVPIEGVHRV